MTFALTYKLDLAEKQAFSKKFAFGLLTLLFFGIVYISTGNIKVALIATLIVSLWILLPYFFSPHFTPDTPYPIFYGGFICVPIFFIGFLEGVLLGTLLVSLTTLIWISHFGREERYRTPFLANFLSAVMQCVIMYAGMYMIQHLHIVISVSWLP
jgi:hypothetical protein